MKGLFLKVTDYRGKVSKLRIDSFMWEDSYKRYVLNEENTPIEEGSKFRFIKCKACGHYDFNEDTTDMNNYGCNGCGFEIQATVFKERV